MSVDMSVYYMGIIDYYTGMIMLDDYIKHFAIVDNKLQKGTIYTGSTYMSYKELKTFLIKCFMEVKSCKSYWDGDIRGLK